MSEFELVTREPLYRKGCRPRVTTEKKDEVVRLYNTGKKLKDIAFECNISVPTVCRIIRKRREYQDMLEKGEIDE